jgi:hypothetical protein
MDYSVCRADEVYQGDGLRLVPSREYPVPVEWDVPLVVVAVSQLEGMVSITVSERAQMVEQAIYGVSAPTHHTVVYDADYPVLLR